jgi:tetratricopeptide (TPR) repeat protein
MGSPWLVAVIGVSVVFFGVQAARGLPTLVRLFVALERGTVKWPGPAVRDPDSDVRLAQRLLGVPRWPLFAALLWRMFLIAAVFSVLLMLFRTGFREMETSGVCKGAFLLFLVFLAFMWRIPSFPRVSFHIDQINKLLASLDSEEEPSDLEGATAESHYAITHPLVASVRPGANADRALILYHESVSLVQDGNQQLAQLRYQQALKMDPSLHERCRETLQQMVEGSNPSDSGAIYYWLGVHSEYLRDDKLAATWYQKAIAAFEEIGYKKRQARVLCNLGSLKMHTGDYSGMEDFEKAVALDPSNGTAHINIGTAYYRVGSPGDDRHERALEAFASAVVADPARYGPVVIAKMRATSYTWKEDLDEITQRVEQKRNEEAGHRA